MATILSCTIWAFVSRILGVVDACSEAEIRPTHEIGPLVVLANLNHQRSGSRLGTNERNGDTDFAAE